jgi:hypothetical protein
MLSISVDNEKVKSEYSDKFNEFVNILRSSSSKYKETPEDEFRFIYSYSYYLKKGAANDEYYENIVHLKFEERLEEEMSKVRVSLHMMAGKFYISDRVEEVSETIKTVVKLMTVRKMLKEQEFVGDIDVIESIPVQEFEGKDGGEIEPLSLEDQLKHAIDVEDYMEAARLRDIINSSKEEELN